MLGVNTPSLLFWFLKDLEVKSEAKTKTHGAETKPSAWKLDYDNA